MIGRGQWSISVRRIIGESFVGITELGQVSFFTRIDQRRFSVTRSLLGSASFVVDSDRRKNVFGISSLCEKAVDLENTGKERRVK